MAKKNWLFPIQKSGTAARPSITVTTMDADREHDRIFPEGIDFANYLKAGGPVMYAHDYNELPIGKTLSLTPQGRGLRADFTWLEGDERAARVRNAYDQGALGAASIGFLVQRAEPNELGGLDIRASDMLEWSLTPVPANPFAVRTLKNLGLWRDADDTVEIVADRVVDIIIDTRKGWTMTDSKGQTVDLTRTDLESLTRAIVQQYQKNIRDNLEPMIAAAVARQVNRLRGRID